MMRVRALAVAVAIAVASPAAAQVITPPNIRKPIQSAQKAANKTSEQIRAAEKAGTEPKTPAAAAQQAASKTAAQKAASKAEAQKGAAKAAPANAKKDARPDTTKAARDSSATRGAASQSGGKSTVTFYREAYSYSDEGRRDPFVSLMATGELRPVLTDLSFIGVIYDPSGARSVATLVDGSTGESFRVQVGQGLGRMRIVKIGERDITLSIDEFGFSRQETLPLDRAYKAPAGGQPGRKPQ